MMMNKKKEYRHSTKGHKSTNTLKVIQTGRLRNKHRKDG